MTGHNRITKLEWWRLGGFANPRCVRVTRRGLWAYYYRLD